MSVGATPSPDGAMLIVNLPLQLKRRGGCKRVVMPDGRCASEASRPQIDSTLVKAVARAHRWQRMLEGGTYASIAELAAAERINPSYLARVLRLTLLAPDLIETVLAGGQASLTLDALMGIFPLEWVEQRRLSSAL
jgi:hypothetical protein